MSKGRNGRHSSGSKLQHQQLQKVLSHDATWIAHLVLSVHRSHGTSTRQACVIQVFAKSVSSQVQGAANPHQISQEIYIVHIHERMEPFSVLKRVALTWKAGRCFQVDSLKLFYSWVLFAPPANNSQYAFSWHWKTNALWPLVQLLFSPIHKTSSAQTSHTPDYRLNHRKCGALMCVRDWQDIAYLKFVRKSYFRTTHIPVATHVQTQFLISANELIKHASFPRVFLEHAFFQ